MPNTSQAHPIRCGSQIMVLHHCVTASFYVLVSVATLAFLATWWLPQAQAEDYMAGAWGCIFGAALCLLMRLAVLVWEDVGDALGEAPAEHRS